MTALLASVISIVYRGSAALYLERLYVARTYRMCCLVGVVRGSHHAPFDIALAAMHDVDTEWGFYTSWLSSEWKKTTAACALAFSLSFATLQSSAIDEPITKTIGLLAMLIAFDGVALSHIWSRHIENVCALYPTSAAFLWAEGVARTQGSWISSVPTLLSQPAARVVWSWMFTVVYITCTYVWNLPSATQSADSSANVVSQLPLWCRLLLAVIPLALFGHTALLSYRFTHIGHEFDLQRRLRVETGSSVFAAMHHGASESRQPSRNQSVLQPHTELQSARAGFPSIIDCKFSEHCAQGSTTPFCTPTTNH